MRRQGRGTQLLGRRVAAQQHVLEPRESRTAGDFAQQGLERARREPVVAEVE